MLGPNANILQIVLFKKTEKQKTQEELTAFCLLFIAEFRLQGATFYWPM